MHPSTIIPQSPCLTIQQFFGKTYLVPPFQRGYAWQESQIKQLLDDFRDFLRSDEPVYLLGQVIVASSVTEVDFELIDGQQRATSILLILIALYRRFEKIPEVDRNQRCKFLQTQLYQLIIYATRMGELRARVTVPNDGIALVEALIRDDKIPEITGWTRENIKEVYDTIVDYLDEEWPDLLDTPDLYNDIVNRVFIVRLELPTPDDAVHVFERINNRGLSLNSADLIKNLIFQNVNEQDYLDHVSTDWDKASSTLYQCENGRVRTMEYLLRSMILIETGENISHKDMRRRWAEIIKTDVIALRFSKSLPVNAIKIKNIDQGKNPNGVENRINDGSKYFSMVQHFPILLAADKLSSVSFSVLARIIEDRVIVSLLAKERPQDFERIIPVWGHKILMLGANAQPDDIREASNIAQKDFSLLLDNARSNLYNLRVRNATHKKRIRYFLARISRKVQIDALEPIVPELSEFLTTSRSSKAARLGYDIEHIRPTALYGDKELNDSIGNLVFAHPMDQRVAGDAMPINKIDVYRTSNLLLTRSLCNSEELILNMAQRNAVRSIHEVAPPYLHDWNDESIQRRFELYWQIFLSDLAIPAK
jgi:hypothetical protein